MRRRGGIWVEHPGERMAGADSRRSVHPAEGRGRQTRAQQGSGEGGGAGRGSLRCSPRPEEGMCHAKRRHEPAWREFARHLLAAAHCNISPGARKPIRSEGRWISSCPAGLRAGGDGSAEDTTLSPMPPPAALNPPWPFPFGCTVPQFPYCNTGPVSGERRDEPEPRGCWWSHGRRSANPSRGDGGEGRGGHGRRPRNKDICFACFAEFQCSDLL